MARALRTYWVLGLAAFFISGCGAVSRVKLPPSDGSVAPDAAGFDDGATDDADNAGKVGDPEDGSEEIEGPSIASDGNEPVSGADGSDLAKRVDSNNAADRSRDAAPAVIGPAKCDDQPAARATVYFRVPRATDLPTNTDFYRLPFPNDIRKRNGRISLQGHPRPGATLLPFDVVDRYIRAIESDSTGFGTNQAVYFRFSHDPDFGSLKQAGVIALVDISVGSPEYGQSKALSWHATTGRTAYVCDRYLAIRPQFGQPLRPGTTYAAVVRTIAHDTNGSAFEQDDDFTTMLAGQAPTDADLAAAWTAYAPLRRYLTEGDGSAKMIATELAAAAVFTTEDVEQPLAAIHTAIAAAPPPAASGFVRCGDPGVVSPCDDGKTGAKHLRGCFPEQLFDAPFDEYQGTLQLPVFQQGTPPYAQPEDGGGILLSSSGSVAIVRSEPVCVSIAVPKGAAPEAGWPLVVYSHGTGGSYRTAIELGLAGEYALGQATGGAAAPMATLGYDGVLHGTRNGGSTQTPDELVYNLYNPRSARDNNLQAAADLLAVSRAITGWSAGFVKLDAGHMSLYGHSQGGNAVALAAARDGGYSASVMSGTGGTLMLSLLGKTKPVSLPMILPLLLVDLSADSNHPVLNLIQMYFDRSDPVNFARRLFREPVTGSMRRHVLHVYGTDDSYAPVETQRRYAQAAGFQVALPLVDSYPTGGEYHMTTVSSPISANQTFGSLGLITAAQVQYAPVGYDGHFVSTQNPSARLTIQKLLVTAVRDADPIIEM